ncbi:MAG: hypothetical protein IPL35_17345 [Sphingobacteriales bacterium]|nr:hypothetical protein [Sphingobacteriales bacterium]
MKDAFLPRNEGERDLWLKNFAQKLSGYTAKYGIAAPELADMQASALYYSFWLDYRNKTEEYLRKVVAFKNELAVGIETGATASPPPTPPLTAAAPPFVQPGIFKRAASLGKRIKSHIAYTLADGNDLGLEGTEQTGSNGFNAIKPLLTLRLVQGGTPEIRWSKKQMQGIRLYVDRGEGKGFEFLAIDTRPNYLDKHDLPPSGKTALWKYKAIYIKEDEAVGQWSDEVQIYVSSAV